MKGLFGKDALGACLVILMFALLLAPAPAKAKVLPPGSYRDSCKDCYVDNGWLHCRCKNGRDGRNDTRIKYTRCNGDIANVDGWLTCGGGGGHHRMPGGSWRDSCRNGRVQGNELLAECRNGNGKWVQAWISLNKCPGNLSNQDGRLVCEGRGGGHRWSMPGGSWRGSCRKARIEGDTLWAECRAKNGDWRGSRVNLRNCGNLNNCNGRLHCGRCPQNQTIR